MTATTPRVLLMAGVLALAACGGASAEAPLVTRPMHTPLDRSVAPPPGDPRPFELPAVADYTLPNGLRVVLVDRGVYPSFSARLIVRAGHDVAGGRPELAELVARTLRDGVGVLGAIDIARVIDNNGIGYSASVGPNAATLAADALADNLPEVLDLLAELAGNATLPEERVLARRDEYAGELRLEQSRESYHRERLTRRVLFGDHPYGAVATAESVATVTVDDVHGFYTRNWTPDRATLLLVGALPDDVRERVETTLGAWWAPPTEYAPPPVPPIATCNVAHVVERPDSAQTVIAWVGPATHPQQEQWFPSFLGNHVLGGNASARLFLNLREDKSFTYGAYSGLAARRDTAFFSASSSVRGDVTAEALAAFQDEFTRLRTESIPADELLGAQDYLAGSFPIRVERNAGLAGELAWALTLGLPLDYFTTYGERVRAVSPEAAQTAGATLVNPNQLTLILVGEPEVVRAAAPGFASTVYVYDLSGALIDTLPGERASTCAAP